MPRWNPPVSLARLHGIPIIIKDQIDAEGMPTTMGSLLFKDYYPDQDRVRC